MQKYGFFGPDSETGEVLDIATTFDNTEVGKPALNISAFYLREYDWGYDRVDPRTKTRPFNNESNDVMYLTGTVSTTYKYNYIQEHESCVQQQTYQWGF